MSLPVGDVTFLFADIEGSTRLARDLGPAAWAATLRDHDLAAAAAVAGAGGTVVKTEGDGMFAVFANPAGAIAAAIELSRSAAKLAPDGPTIRLRVGVHTGDGVATEGGLDYVGLDVHYAARLAAAGNGGQILVSDATAARVVDAIPSGASLDDEGFHRLRDFDEARRIHRLVVPGAADDSRPLRTADLPGNLPEPVTTFVGRDRELADVAQLLLETRIITLSGPGGTGKTRLAIGVASAARPRFRDGTWFVELAPVRDPALVPATIAVAIGVHESPDRPVLEALRDHLRERSLLVVIDSPEQVLPAAAGTLADLIRGAAGLRMIVTSREILRIAGEQEYPVPPLGGPDAVELFVERARLVRPGFELTATGRPAVEAIAGRLEGLPLAVELAAARTRLFSPERILERLGRALDLGEGARDLPERQRTLRGAIAWSVDLLSPDEQVIFRRIAVFSGGWTADAATAVADPDASLSVTVMTGLESLADKSLVRIVPTDHGEPRFNRHAFIREYAAELLEAANERPPCERRHAQVYLEFAEAAEPHLLAEGSEAWLDLIDHERHNLRAAMRWSLTVREPELGMRIAGAIWRFWHQRSELREGRTWLTELLAHPAAQADSVARFRALSAAGGLAYWMQDFEPTRVLYEEMLALAERLGDPRLLADALYEIGFLAVIDRDSERLRRHEERALELYESLGDHAAVVRTRQALVLGHFVSGDRAQARDIELLNLDDFRRSGSNYRTSDSLNLLAVIELEMGNHATARAHVREALAILGPRGVATQTVGILSAAAEIELATGDPEIGARLAGAAAALAARAEITNALVEVLHVPDPVTVARERLGASADRLLAEGAELPVEEAIALASRPTPG